MSNALDNLVSSADAAAANFQPPVPIPDAPSTALATPMSRPSLDSFIDGGGLDVDAFVRLNDTGIRFGDKMQGVVDEFEATINMAEVTPIYSFRYEVGGNTKFLKSYDGATTSDGQNFQAACARANAIPGAKCSGVYPTVEIPMTLTKAVVDPKKQATFDVGATIGYTPSVTGFKAFQSLSKKLRSENPELLTSTITVKATHAVRTNTNNNRWGVIEFERIA